MLQSRKDLLDELDFVWVADNWDAMYEELVKFKLEHGNTEVPGNKVAWTIGAGSNGPGCDRTSLSTARPHGRNRF
jgi:hypothetical protein